MTDEEFLELKKHISEVADMCYQINNTYYEFKRDISELGKSISKFKLDIDELQNEVKSLEDF